MIDVDPSIELVIDKPNGRVKSCYILNEDGSRGADLPITAARERYGVSEPGIVSIDIHSFRVKRTEANAV